MCYIDDRFYCLISKKEMYTYKHVFVEHEQQIIDLTTALEHLMFWNIYTLLMQ
jgi:hypothetical protein